MSSGLWKMASRMGTRAHRILMAENCASSRRFLTSQAARALLGLPSKPPAPPASQAAAKAKDSVSLLTLKELRQAYFAAAKRCHPDMQPQQQQQEHQDNDDNDDDDEENSSKAGDEFLQVTLAYELLQAELLNNNNNTNESIISESEEAAFRRACKSELGIDAEIVEECKQNPIFRQWLSGRTDSAHYWRTFFMQHGGLAPKLRPAGSLLGAGANAQIPSHRTRRKRK